MTIGHYKKNPVQYFEQLVYGDGTTGADTIVLMGPAGQVYAPPGTGVPQPVIRPFRMTGVGVFSATLGATVPGNWTINLYKNASFPSTVATFTFNPTTISEVFTGQWDSIITFDPGDYWYVSASGTERNLLLLRVTLGFELL